MNGDKITLDVTPTVKSAAEAHALAAQRQQGEDDSITVNAASNMFARYRPVPGDYYVVYEDGYASISPRQAFEEGYHRL